MKSIEEIIIDYKTNAENCWVKSYSAFTNVLNKYNSKIGVEIGVAFGGHSEHILQNTNVEILYGIDPYLHIEKYNDPMNLPQEQFDELYKFTINRLSNYNNRYKHIRKKSCDAINDIKNKLDFVYIDADHSYNGVFNDLCLWFQKIEEGGIIGGHDYEHPNFPGVKQAIDEFFRRFNWKVNYEGDGVWWVEKKKINISFFIPAYNCFKTIAETVDSIFNDNFMFGDELIIVNDASKDETPTLIEKIRDKYRDKNIKIITHKRNKGGAAARNTAIENSNNPLLFCLDSDNILEKNSIQELKDFLINSGSDASAFRELKYFKENVNNITHTWKFTEGKITLEKMLSDHKTPPASGNYLFSKESWERADGYPEFAGALDTWGFGFRQIVTGSKMSVMNDLYYFHRHGTESYWVTFSKNNSVSLRILQIIAPHLDRISDKDVKYITNPKTRHTWYNNIEKKPLRIKKENKYKFNALIYIKKIFVKIKNKLRKKDTK